MNFNAFLSKVAAMGPFGVAVSTFVGGVGTYVLSAPDVAAAITNFVASAAGAPFSWKGALIAGAAAVASKVMVNAKPPAPPVQ